MSRYAQRSRLGHGERYVGTYRAVLDLAETSRKGIGESTATISTVGRNQGTNYRRRWQNRFQDMVHEREGSAGGASSESGFGKWLWC